MPPRCGCIAPWPMSRRFYSLSSIWRTPRGLSVPWRTSPRQAFIPGGLQSLVSFSRTDLRQSKAFGVARPLVTGCGQRSRLVPVGDYAAIMKTGIVCRKLRSIGSGKDAQVVEEYEIDTSAVEALNSIERRAAIETGEECEPDRT